MASFEIHGGTPLSGSVRISGSKNAALPILAATLLTDETCILRDVPDIEDIHTMIEILKSLGSEVKFQKNTITIQTRRIQQGKVPAALGCKMRASVLLLGPLLARTGYARLPYPGGCVLGARPIDTHTEVLRQLGIKKLRSAKEEIIFEGRPSARNVVLPEFSVTATENALLAAARTTSETTIRLAAVEPHVQDLCRFLEKMGVKISGIGTHTVSLRGATRPGGVTHTITPDYLEAGTYILAAIVTRGRVLIRNINPDHLDAFWNLLREMRVHFELKKDSVSITPTRKFFACRRLQTNVFPGFPTDLQPPFVVLLSQAEGQSHIHETLFEGRFNYFPELIKMGAKISTLNPHEAVITGPVKLRAKRVKSWDIRAGAALIVAALAAKGKTVVTDIHYIDRGYERFDEKLKNLGARIRRID